MTSSAASLETRDDAFFLNGTKIIILSGAVHYFRIHPEYWQDRLLRLKACGLNCVETYVPWNLHEEIKDEFNFEGILDVRKFIQMAHDLGLYVLFRPGPYICSEWDFGGLPSWLLHDPSMKVRSSYEPFLKAVEHFFAKLLPLVTDLQRTKGGPIIAVQIENEYGSYGDDVEYMSFLKNTMEKLGIVELLFTSDNGTGIQGIKLPGVLMTANFQEKDHGFVMYEYMKNVKQPKMPLMAMEFWTGWFDHWGEKHHVVSNEQFEKTLSWMLDIGSSVNFYMFHGGTNFGFMAGANEGQAATNDNNSSEPYAADVTSYDYDAPVAENGDLTEKYFIIQKLLKQKKMGNEVLPDIDVSPTVESRSYGEVKITKYLGFEDIIEQIEGLPAHNLLTMEQLFINNGGGQGYGFILYRKDVGEVKKVLFPGRVRDRAIVMLNGKEVETFDCHQYDHVTSLSTNPGKNKLDIFVENMGRCNYADFNSSVLNEQHKGIREIELDGKMPSHDWTIYPFEMKKPFIQRLAQSNKWKEGKLDETQTGSPCFCRAILTITGQPKDTFINMSDWKKGVVFVNGFNIGRYWEIGPQRTLYVPGPLLHEGDNQLLIFELHRPAGQLKFEEKCNLGEIVLHKTVVPIWMKPLLTLLKTTLRMGSWVWIFLRPFVK